MTNRNDNAPLVAFLLVCLTGAIGVGTQGCQPKDPGNPSEGPLYRPPGQSGEATSGERGKILINEIHYAGSVENDGTYHPDDVFIELMNKGERPLNLSGWRIIVEGDVTETYTLPQVEQSIETNEFFVIASNKDGAFGEAADVVVDELKLGRKHFEITIRDADRRLQTSAGSTEADILAGGYDTYTARSMERVQLLFSNNGGRARNWHAYTTDGEDKHRGLPVIDENYRERTLASPGEANSTDYSGSTASGSFE